jgi:hypothetical protein
MFLPEDGKHKQYEEVVCTPISSVALLGEVVGELLSQVLSRKNNLTTQPLRPQ